MKIVFASNNKNKLKEIREIFKEYEILSLNDVNCKIDVIEDGKTFYDNALKKAKEIYNYINIPVISDDSGLCIKELEMFPGVMTDRFIDGTAEEKNIELINKTRKLQDKEAYVICELIYYDGKNIINGTGKITGKITNEPRGNNGFGFDPIFELSNKKTLAELTSKEKNKTSARYIAANNLLKKLIDK